MAKPSLDELLEKRAGDLMSTASGDAIVKAFKAPASWNPEMRSARFVMSGQTPDRYKDVVVTAGLDTAEFEKNPQGLLFHNSRSWPVGAWSDLVKITGRNARLEGTLTFLPEGDLQEADTAARMVERGVLRACSIGFLPKDYEWIKDAEDNYTGGIRFLESELVECSIVPIPAHPQALVKDAGGDLRLAREIVEDILDTWAKTPEGLLVPRAEYEAAYRSIKAADFRARVEKDAVDAVDAALAEDTHQPEQRRRSFLERIQGAFSRALGIETPPEQPTPEAEEQKTAPEAPEPAEPVVPLTAEQRETALAKAKTTLAKLRAENRI